MTFALLASNIANSISALSISGVTIKDVDEVSESWILQSNILYPNVNPPGFIVGSTPNYIAMLQGANAPIDISYSMNYRFLGTKIGDMNFTQAYASVFTKMSAIIDAIIANPAPYSGRVEMKLGAWSIGAKEDPAGNQFHGSDFELLITELQN